MTGEARIVSITSEADFAKYRGKLTGAIVLSTPPSPVGLRYAPDAERLTADQLRSLDRGTIGAQLGIDSVEYRSDPVEKMYVPIGTDAASGGVSPTDLLTFFKTENVGVVLQAAPGQDGTVFWSDAPGVGRIVRTRGSWHHRRALRWRRSTTTARIASQPKAFARG